MRHSRAPGTSGGLASIALLLIPLVAFCSYGCRVLDTPADHLPVRNLILISLDTLRADHLGAYGYPRNTSPHLDRIAAVSTVFEHCYAQAPVTLPSHMSIFTGLYPHQHGVTHGGLVLPESTPTLAGILRQRGFATAAFTAGGFMREQFGYHGFELFQNSRFHDASYRSEDEQFDRMLNWLDEQAGPFFLFWHSYRVHSPYNPPPEADLFSDSKYGGIVEVSPQATTDVCKGVQAKGCRWKGPPYFKRILPQMGAEDIGFVVDKYDGEISSLDNLVGRLWSRLGQMGRLEDTAVVITSDHGESFADRPNEPWIGHGFLYREILHVPLIVYIPGAEPTRRAETVETVGILPTALQLVGANPPRNLAGRSLWPGDGSEQTQAAMAEDWDERGLVAASIVQDNYHLIRRRDGTDQLFELTRDPSEQSNLVNERGEIAAALARQLSRIPRGSSANATESRELDEETIGELGALGYL